MPIFVVPAHEPIVMADVFTSQPTVGVVLVVHDHSALEEAQKTLVIVAVVLVHSDSVVVGSNGSGGGPFP